jgi:hypothetical protein
VRQVLCAHDCLALEETPFYQGLVMRSGRAYGLFFQVQGPRMMRTYALWVAEEDRILFYDSTGVRFAETHLSDGNAYAELLALHSTKRAGQTSERAA